MAKKCSKCEIIEPKETVICDSCKKILCKKCSELSETEIRCIGLKKRRLTFLCEECESGVTKIPDILKQLESIQKEVCQLKEVLKEKYENHPDREQNNDFEDMVAEMVERQKRASNIMITNVKEAQGNSKERRDEQDKATVKNLLKDMEVDLNNIKINRMGKFDPTKNRLIKVMLNKPSDALTILKNKKKLNTQSVNIFSDQTKRQRDYFKSIKKQLDDLINSGDDSKRIKYINNKPTIVQKNLNSNLN